MGRVWTGVMLGMVSVTLHAPVSRAQTLFEWPKDSIDLGTYQTVEQCLAATGRAWSEWWQPAEAWRDTLPITLAGLREKAREATPGPIRQTARRCGAPYVATTVPLSDFALRFTLLLASGRDSDAATLVTRRLQAIAPTDTVQRMWVLDTIIHMYLSSAPNHLGNQHWVESLWLPGNTSAALPFSSVQPEPPRVAAAERLVRELDGMKWVSWVIRGDCWQLFALSAWATGDTVRAFEAVRALTELATGLTDAERRSSDFVGRLGAVLDYIQMLSARAAMLDSLRHSTAAYGAAYYAFWKRVFHGAIPAGVTRPIGKAAPPVAGDMWFGRRDSATSRPTRGKVSLVVYLDERHFLTFRGEPSIEWPVLRRLAQRFPDLEITLMAQTYGHFGLTVPPRPPDEARMLAQALAERHVPGALAVTTGSFWRLPTPDRRRINQPMPNVLNYSFGRTWNIMLDGPLYGTSAAAVLVDQDGNIVDVYENFANAVEEELSARIEILLHRPHA